jgi:hypothetical protein
LVSVTLFTLELPALILPKARFVGLAIRVTDAATPVPLRVNLLGELGALLEMEIVPLRFPAVVGANSALNEALWPAAIIAGVESPLTVNPAPATDNCTIVRGADPVFVTVNVCDFVCPKTTLP